MGKYTVIAILAYTLLNIPIIWWSQKGFRLNVNFRGTLLLSFISSVAYWLSFATLSWLNQLFGGFQGGAKLLFEIGIWVEYGVLFYYPCKKLARIDFPGYSLLSIIDFVILNHTTWLIIFSFASRYPNTIK
jgi:hypothetical protein